MKNRLKAPLLLAQRRRRWYMSPQTESRTIRNEPSEGIVSAYAVHMIPRHVNWRRRDGA